MKEWTREERYRTILEASDVEMYLQLLYLEKEKIAKSSIQWKNLKKLKRNLRDIHINM